MPSIHRSIYTTILVSLAFCACATDQELRIVDDQHTVRQIRSAEDLDIYLQRDQRSPLDYLSTSGRQRFVNSLVFNENGLASFRYAELETLTTGEIYEILQLFGVERTASMIKMGGSSDSAGSLLRQRTEGDIKDAECQNPHTCSSALGSWCMSSC